MSEDLTVRHIAAFETVGCDKTLDQLAEQLARDLEYEVISKLKNNSYVHPLSDTQSKG